MKELTNLVALKLARCLRKTKQLEVQDMKIHQISQKYQSYLLVELDFFISKPLDCHLVMKILSNDRKSSKNFINFITLIRNWKKLEQSCNILIRKLCIILHMSEVSWKCFRCNLTFKDENIADIHKEISKHSITKVKPITI